jgi:hypothetical protein
MTSVHQQQILALYPDAESFIAAREGNLEVLRSRGTNLNEMHAKVAIVYGQTPAYQAMDHLPYTYNGDNMHIAAYFGNYDIFEMARFPSRDSLLESLIYARAGGQKSMCRYLESILPADFIAAEEERIIRALMLRLGGYAPIEKLIQNQMKNLQVLARDPSVL